MLPCEFHVSAGNFQLSRFWSGPFGGFFGFPQLRQQRNIHGEFLNSGGESGMTTKNLLWINSFLAAEESWHVVCESHTSMVWVCAGWGESVGLGGLEIGQMDMASCRGYSPATHRSPQAKAILKTPRERVGGLGGDLACLTFHSHDKPREQRAHSQRQISPHVWSFTPPSGKEGPTKIDQN